MWTSCEDLDAAEAEKTAKPYEIGILKINETRQSFQLGLLRPGQRRARLSVLAPRRPTLLTGTQNPGVQTIPFERNML